MTRKIAISMSEDVYRRLERIRRTRSLSRSAAVQGALGLWLNQHERSEAAKAYADGYRRTPEQMQEVEAWSNAEAWGPFEEE